MPTQIERIEESATRGILLREVNEHIAELNGAWGEVGVCSLICECSDPDCAESLEIEPAEYERVRVDGAGFLVLAGHERPEVERVVERTDRFLVVEKIRATTGIAFASDPRRKARNERNAV